MAVIVNRFYLCKGVIFNSIPRSKIVGRKGQEKSAKSRVSAWHRLQNTKTNARKVILGLILDPGVLWAEVPNAFKYLPTIAIFKLRFT